MTAMEEYIRGVEDILNPRSADGLIERGLEIPLLDCVNLLGRSYVHNIDLVGSNSNNGSFCDSSIIRRRPREIPC
jgi:hypothetical protein